MHRRTVLLGGLAAGLATRTRAAPPPVVLELFTSQSCSSCPPAEALLGRLAGQPGVIGLAWHVDYFNGLGWRDPFSDRRWTDRQRAYAAALHQEVFTPALVVNGAALVVGSDAGAVAAALRAAGPLPVTVELRRTPDGLEATVGAGTPQTALLVAYDPQRSTAVTGGENGGRRLTDYRVVRSAQPVALTAGPTHLPAPPAGQGVALLVQAPDGRLAGAAELPPM